MRLALICILTLATGCTIQMQPTPEVEKTLKQHSIVLDSIVLYIQDCQAKGICPKPEQEVK